MSAIRRLVGYDRTTDRMCERDDILDVRFARAAEIAEVDADDPDAAWSYLLTAAQARQIADLIGVEVDCDGSEFFLEAFGHTNPGERAA